MSQTSSREPTPVCNPLCRFFRCIKKVLNYKQNPPLCDWVGGICTGHRCPYASCVQVKLLSDGRCGLFVKRKTAETGEPEIKFGADVTIRAKKRLEKFGA